MNVIYRTSLPTILKRELNHSPFVAFDRLFEELLRSAGNVPAANISMLGKQTYPKVNVVEEDDKLLLSAAVPGMTKEDVSVDVENTVEGDVLTISGGKQEETSEEDSPVYLKRELHKSSFRRSWCLGDNLDGDNIKATVKDGILSVEIFKKVPDSKKKRTIEVE